MIDLSMRANHRQRQLLRVVSGLGLPCFNERRAVERNSGQHTGDKVLLQVVRVMSLGDVAQNGFEKGDRVVNDFYQDPSAWLLGIETARIEVVAPHQLVPTVGVETGG